MSSPQKKARGDAVLKNMPDALQEEFYQLLRRTTQEKALAWLEQTHGIKSSTPSATAFFQWYPRQMTLRAAAATSTQLEETIKKIPALKVTAAQARQVAQINFEIQAAQNRDPELYLALGKGALEAERLRLEREKFEHGKKEDWEHGVDALHEEMSACPAALDLLQQAVAAFKKWQEANG